MQVLNPKTLTAAVNSNLQRIVLSQTPGRIWKVEPQIWYPILLLGNFSEPLKGDLLSRSAQGSGVAEGLVFRSSAFQRNSSPVEQIAPALCPVATALPKPEHPNKSIGVQGLGFRV